MSEAAPLGNDSTQSKSCHSPRWCTCTSPWRGDAFEARPLVCGWRAIPCLGTKHATPMCPAARAPAGGLQPPRATALAFRRLLAPWDMHRGTEGQHWQSLARAGQPRLLPCNPCTYIQTDLPRTSRTATWTPPSCRPSLWAIVRCTCTASERRCPRAPVPRSPQRLRNCDSTLRRKV